MHWGKHYNGLWTSIWAINGLLIHIWLQHLNNEFLTNTAFHFTRLSNYQLVDY